MSNDQIQIPLLGIRTATSPGSPVDSPGGSGMYVFEYFESHVDLEDVDGLRSYSGNVCILYPPGQRTLFKAGKHSNHTWFYLQGDGLSECLERYSIPTFRAIVGLLDPSTLITFLESVRRHSVQQEIFWENAVTVLSRTFFRNLSRSIAQGAHLDKQSVYQRENLNTLRHVRGEVHAEQDLHTEPGWPL